MTCNATGNDYDFVSCPDRCDLAVGGCIECVSNDQCSNPQPICEATSHACRGCVRDDECPSQVCNLVTGTCTASSDVIYAAHDGVGATPCIQAQPCPLDRAIATGAVAPATPAIIRMLPGTFELAVAVNTSKELSIIATGATLKTSFNPGLAVGSGANLEIRGLQFELLADSSISCGFQATTRARLTLRQSSVTPVNGQTFVENCAFRAFDSVFNTGNLGLRDMVRFGSDAIVELDRVRLVNPTGSARDVQGFGERMSMRITNSVFDHVGLVFTANDPTGGATSSQFDIGFSTLVNATFDCFLPSTRRYAARFENNILTWTSGAVVDYVRFGTACTFAQNMFFPAANQGGTNRDVDPKLVNTTLRDYQLQSSSPAIDTAVPSTLFPATNDVVNVTRPQGPQPDVGAFERKP
ncbi:MAG: hypothetical protein M3619_26645 [Myxococcota bacterium]|nr:hypothetical protein [Myxococcota bacterium]